MAQQDDFIFFLENMADGLERLGGKSEFIAVDNSRYVDNPALNMVGPPQVAPNGVEARHDARFRAVQTGAPFDEAGTSAEELAEVPDALVDRFVGKIVGDVLGA